MEKIQKFFNKIKGWLGFAADIITIFLLMQGKNKQALYALIFVIIFIFIDSLFIIIPIFSTRRAQKRIVKKYFTKGKVIGESLHRFHHKLRDYISMASEEKDNDNRTWNRLGELLCNSIYDIYENIFSDYLIDDQKISVCIKTIKANSILDTDYMKWKMETFARSPATGPERTTNDETEILVSRNSDFQVIISDKYRNNYIAFADMTNIKKTFLNEYKIEYDNSREDFYNYYQSCIIMPIEIDGSNASEEIKEILPNIKKRKLLLGFLCIDSMKVFNNDEEIEAFEMGTSIAKALADSLYPFFEQILLHKIHNNFSCKVSVEV